MAGLMKAARSTMLLSTEGPLRVLNLTKHHWSRVNPHSVHGHRNIFCPSANAYLAAHVDLTSLLLLHDSYCTLTE